MNWIPFNPNPESKYVGDCVIRALSLALNKDWSSTYLELMVKGYEMCDMPSSNAVWAAYLRSKGYTRHTIPNECPDCYTVNEFCIDNPRGVYILATGTHVVTVKDGKYYDTWDSGNEVPMYFFMKEFRNGL